MTKTFDLNVVLSHILIGSTASYQLDILLYNTKKRKKKSKLNWIVSRNTKKQQKKQKNNNKPYQLPLIVSCCNYTADTRIPCFKNHLQMFYFRQSIAFPFPN